MCYGQPPAPQNTHTRTRARSAESDYIDSWKHRAISRARARSERSHIHTHTQYSAPALWIPYTFHFAGDLATGSKSEIIDFAPHSDFFDFGRFLWLLEDLRFPDFRRSAKTLNSLYIQWACRLWASLATGSKPEILDFASGSDFFDFGRFPWFWEDLWFPDFGSSAKTLISLYIQGSLQDLGLRILRP